MMPIMASSVTEAELFAAVECAQDMIYVMQENTSYRCEAIFPSRIKGRRSIGMQVEEGSRPDFERHAAQFVGVDQYIDPGTHKGR
eukprot:3432476-Ditylum_brightwellii.AAC.1